MKTTKEIADEIRTYARIVNEDYLEHVNLLSGNMLLNPVHATEWELVGVLKLRETRDVLSAARMAEHENDEEVIAWAERVMEDCLRNISQARRLNQSTSSAARFVEDARMEAYATVVKRLSTRLNHDLHRMLW